MAIGVGAAMIGSAVIGGLASAFGQSSANKAAQRASREQMDFQRESYQNRYQWSMADMRKAGLNPILAYKSSPGSGLGGASYAPGNVGAGVSSAAEGVRQGIRAKAEIDNIKADTAVKNETKQKTYTEIQNNHMQYKLMLEHLHSAKAAAASAKTEEKFFETEWGKFLKKLDLTGRAINPFAKAGSSAKDAISR